MDSLRDNVQERGDLNLLKTKSLRTLQITQRICAKKKNHFPLIGLTGKNNFDHQFWSIKYA
jgi:hypothetical protein